MEARKLLHIDMDAFFASVEQREHPSWKGKPVIVGGRENRRGVVSTCSYEARRFGVHSAMPMKEAKKLCPHGIFVPVHFDLYRQVSKEIRDIFSHYTDQVEPLSIDEAYLDVTENYLKVSSATIVGQQIQQEIQEKTGLTCSIGVSFTKFLSKVASDYNKPNGMTVVTPDNFQEFVEELPIDNFYGVGKKSAEKLKSMGIYTGKELLQVSLYELTKKFGKQGYVLYHQVRGESSNRLTLNRQRKSLGKETTFPKDIEEREHLESVLEEFAYTLSKELEEKQYLAKTITIKMRNHDFETVTKSKTLAQTFMGGTFIYEEALELFHLMDKGEPIRLLGLSLGQLQAQKEQYQQLTLF